MRKLNTTDFFKISKIYDKMDIKMNVTSKSTPEVVGAELINGFIRHMWKAQTEVIEFIADISEKQVKEVENLNPIALVNLIKDIMKQEGAYDFFIQALK